MGQVRGQVRRIVPYRLKRLVITNYFGNIIIFKETNPLLLDSDWKEGDGGKWSRKATIKIFDNEAEYNQYQNENPNA